MKQIKAEKLTLINNTDQKDFSFLGGEGGLTIL